MTEIFQHLQNNALHPVIQGFLFAMALWFVGVGMLAMLKAFQIASGD